MIPVIETERLRLRGHELADFDKSAAMWALDGTTRYISGKPSTREESWGRFVRYPGQWALLGYGYWLIEEKASGRYLGEGGWLDGQRELEPKLDAPEQGWALVPEAHGKGYALEAARAMLDWAEPHFGRSDFVCIISPENQPSLKLAAKLAYAEYARTTYKGDPIALLRRS